MPLEFSIFRQYPELQYGLSEKKDGSMKLFNDIKKDKTAFKNRKKYFSQLDIPLERIVSAGLTHSDNIQIVEQKHGKKIISNTDALATDKSFLFLTITVADCFPVYFYVPSAKAIALVHAGWRGIVNNIVGVAVDTILKNWHTSADKILVGIGPGIQKCHFEIKEDVLENFKKYPRAIIKKEKRIFIDLQSIILKQLKDAGIKDKNIENNNECVFCLKNKYFSYRRDKPQKIKAMISYIGIKK